MTVQILFSSTSQFIRKYPRWQPPLDCITFVKSPVHNAHHGSLAERTLHSAFGASSFLEHHQALPDAQSSWEEDEAKHNVKYILRTTAMKKKKVKLTRGQDLIPTSILLPDTSNNRASTGHCPVHVFQGGSKLLPSQQVIATRQGTGLPI